METQNTTEMKDIVASDLELDGYTGRMAVVPLENNCDGGR